MDDAAVTLAHEKAFRIGPVEVRPATRELIHQDRSSIVEPRVMQVLVALYRAGGSVVSKDDLIQHCWGGRVVGEDAINRVLSRLRHDAEEKAGGAFRIETITRVGYRLVERGAASGAGVAAKPIDRRRALAVGGGTVAAAAVGIAAWTLLDEPNVPPEAQRLYEQGKAGLREGTIDQFANAVGKFRSAAEIAPDVAKMWGGLALAYQLQTFFAPSVQAPTLREKRAAAAKRALALDPDDPDALASQVLSVRLFGNWQTYERSARSALRRAPDNSTIKVALATVLSQVGRFREALPFIQDAVKIEPMAPRYRMFLANALQDVGRIEEAEREFESAFRLWPRHYAVWFSRYYFLAHNGRAQEALAMIADAPSRPVGIPEWNFEITALHAQALANPKSPQINAVVARMMETAKRGVGLAEGSIPLLAALDRVDAVYEILDGYYFDRGFSLGEQRFSKEQGLYSGQRLRNTFFLFIPRLANVRRDRRFGPLLKILGLEDYWRQTGTIPDFRRRG